MDTQSKNVLVGGIIIAVIILGILMWRGGDSNDAGDAIRDAADETADTIREGADNVRDAVN